MPRPCSVCTHTDRSEIERALEAGEPFRLVAERYGLAPSSLSRHKANHLEARDGQEDRKPPQENTREERLAALEGHVEQLREAMGVIGGAVVKLARKP